MRAGWDRTERATLTPKTYTTRTRCGGSRKVVQKSNKNVDKRGRVEKRLNDVLALWESVRAKERSAAWLHEPVRWRRQKKTRKRRSGHWPSNIETTTTTAATAAAKQGRTGQEQLRESGAGRTSWWKWKCESQLDRLRNETNWTSRTKHISYEKEHFTNGISTAETVLKLRRRRRLKQTRV